MVRVCLIQNCPDFDKSKNLINLYKIIPNEKIDILMFPECFNSPYGIEHFENYAEEIKEGNETFDFLKNLSIMYPNTYIIAGSIPELYENKIYNTCTVWKQGNIITKYRKNNLFDVKIPNAEFTESDILSPGDKLAMFETEWGRVGLGICFDIRFNQISNIYSNNNCNLICYPANFTKITGDMHWDVLNKARAIDSHTFILSCSTATSKNDEIKFKSYGNSIIVSPWGNILSKLDDKEGILTYDIDMNLVNDMREKIPINQFKSFNL